MAKRKKSNLNLFWISIVLIGLLGLIVLNLIKNSKSKLTSNNQALVSYIPNFESLTINDLPNFTDFRDMHDYNGHLLVIGINRIVEYDKENNKFIRVNDPKVLGCIYDSTKIGDHLYVSCNPRYVNGKSYDREAKTIIASAVYKIDLKTGKIVKTYFGSEIPINPANGSTYAFTTKGAKTNLELGSKGDILYMRSWDGIEKMDTKTGKLSEYTLSNDWNRTKELDGTGLGVPIGMGSPINTPEFISISPLREDKYYILATDGLYVLTQGQFPEKIIDSAIETGEEDSFKSTYAKDGRYLVFVSPSIKHNQGQILSYGIGVFLFDIDKKSMADLSKVIKKLNNPKSGTLEDVISKRLKTGYFEEAEGEINFKDAEGIILFTLDPANLNLKINVK